MPLSKAEVKVGKPVELSPLYWSTGENNPIQAVFPGFSGKPIDFFEIYLSLTRQERQKLTTEQRDILKKEFDHIKNQLKEQSKIFMQEFRELFPGYLKEVV